MKYPIFGVDIARLLRSLDRGLDIRPVLSVDQFPPRVVGPVVGTCWNSVHGFEIGRPAVLTLARVNAPLERRGASSLLCHFQHLLARPELLLEALALGGVARDAVVAAKRAILVEDRQAAGADVTHGPVGGRTGILEFAERLCCRGQRSRLGPAATTR